MTGAAAYRSEAAGPSVPLGIVAGGGALPREIADAAARSGRAVVIVALEGECEPATFAPHAVTVVKWGEIGRMIRTFETAGVADIVIVGSVTRPDLTQIRTDAGFFLSLPEIVGIIVAGGDDSVLRRVVRFFEQHGFQVLAPDAVAPGLLASVGPIGRSSSDGAAARDIAVGLDVVARLAPFDIGQAIVVRDGKILAIEAAEGTDRMLDRLVRRVKFDGARAGVLVKRSKPGQERRVDLPAIGPATVSRVAALGLAGIAVEAGATLVAEREMVAEEADRAGLFVEGIELAMKPVAGVPGLPSLEDDRAIAAGVASALGSMFKSEAIIVARRRVLAVEAGEGAIEAIGRAARFRSWGLGRWLGGAGIAALSELAAKRADVKAAAREAGLQLVVLNRTTSGDRA